MNTVAKTQRQIFCEMLKRGWLTTWLAILALTLMACAVPSASTSHTFSFDALRDSKDVEVLQYRYGDDGGFETRSTATEILAGKPVLSANTTGEILVGKDLYVKWRIKSTGQILEDTVDLRSRIPFSIKRHNLRFIIEGNRLYVYLISYDPVRPFFSKIDAERIRASAETPREKALIGYARNRVTLIYPEKLIDHHIPAEFR